MLPIQIHLSHLLVVLMFCSGPALAHEHLCDGPSQPGSPPRQQYPATMEQPRWVYLCIDSYSASITATTSTGHLSSALRKQRGKVLAIFPIQQYLKPAGWLSPLQTDWTHLLLQQFLQLVIGDPIHLPSTSNAFLQYIRTHQ